MRHTITVKTSNMELKEKTYRLKHHNVIKVPYRFVPHFIRKFLTVFYPSILLRILYDFECYIIFFFSLPKVLTRKNLPILDVSVRV